jgi:short-subunit dehydrogenase
VVIVTGASSGIGEAAARAFGARGDSVVLMARRRERLQAVAASLQDSLPLSGDITHQDDRQRLVDQTLARYGRIDVLVNNAGVGIYDWIDQQSEEAIQQEVATNLVAPIMLARAVTPVMLQAGGGVIINVGSVASRVGTPMTSIYNATKFGLHGFTEALRRELGPQGIAVCGIYPGGVEGTEFRRHRRVDPGVTTPGWLRLRVDRVAQEIVALADRPRAERILPGIFRPVIAINALWPTAVDAVMMRRVHRTRGLA